MRTKSQILEEFQIFAVPAGGIGTWITEATHDDVFARLGKLDEEPLTAVQLNQLLVLGREAPVSDGFFQYYWLLAPEAHPHPVRDIPGFEERWTTSESVVSIQHLKWGLYRLYVDALLYFGNVRSAFRALRDLPLAGLQDFFEKRAWDTAAIKRRGPALPLRPIAKDDRYLISEMACKSYGETPTAGSDLREALLSAYRTSAAAGRPSATVRELLGGNVPPTFDGRQQEFLFSADDVLDEHVHSEDDLAKKYQRVAERFTTARQAALDNTRFYLSMVNDLDVYVATSMRSRQDFRNMANTCDRIFADSRLKELNLRYFDPTLSAAGGHEDKGLIECLMVKCAKALVYCAGDRESYGKDAEAAMALTLGKPVVFYCDQEQRSRFYRDVHPLSRLIEFETGIAVGAIVTDRPEDVSELLHRVFENKMSYRLEQSKPGFLRLRETLTDSVVRLQTNDELLAETFWNHYHRDRDQRRAAGVGSA
jgi:hypothetical protein